MKRNRKFALLVVLAIAALPVFAQNVNSNSKVYRDGGGWVEELSGSIPSSTSLRVNTDMGSIEVAGGAQKEITYTVRKRVHTGSEEYARHDLAGFRIVAAKRGDAAVLEGSSEGRHGRINVEFHVQVPREMQQVRANTDGGNVSMRNLAARVVAQSSGGNISLSDLGGEVAADTGGGSIDVSNVSNALSVNTGGGSIKINGAKGKISASTGGGSIILAGASDAAKLTTGGGSVKVQQCNSELFVTTGGGSIDVGDVSGKVRMDTGGGSIHLTSARGPVIANTGGGSIELYKLMQGARAETGAGPITAEFLGAGSTDSILETSVGDVIVYVGPQAKVTVKAELDMANGHKIRSDFPDLKISSDGGEYGPKNYYAQGSLNGGGPVLRVRTMSGNIEFRRAR